MSATVFWLVASNLHVCEIGYETFRKYAWLIFHGLFSQGQDTASPADTKSNRCQKRWNMYGPPNGRSGDDISKHMAQWMFTQCENKLISGCGLERGVKKKCFSPWQKSICPDRKAGGVYGGDSSGKQRQLETSDTERERVCGRLKFNYSIGSTENVCLSYSLLQWAYLTVAL